MLSQEIIEKTVHFFEHQNLLNQCMFFADFLVKCYPLDTQKPDPKLFDYSYIFHGGHFDLFKNKIAKICCLVSSKNKDKLFLGHNFGSGLASNIEEYRLKISS